MMTRARFLTAAALAATACQRSGKKRIGVVPKATSHLFFLSVKKGAEAAAKEADVEMIWNGPQDETDHNRQIQIVDSLIAQRVDGIALSATDERALAPAAERAVKAGIPLSVFDSGVNYDGYITFVATGNREAGQTAARWLTTLIGGKGKVAMVMHKPGGLSTVLREEGFLATMSKDYPAVTVAQGQYGMADAAKARAAAENILTAHPDLAGIFATSEASSLGSIQALRARGLAKKVKLITFDTSDTHVEALRDGTIDIMLVQDSFQIGYHAVRSLVIQLAGGIPRKRIDLPARQIFLKDLDTPGTRTLLGLKG
jgi:ribose transport system substrate-binding protein